MSTEKLRSSAEERSAAHGRSDMTVEALTIRYAVLRSVEMLDELPEADRAQVALLLARDLLLIAQGNLKADKDDVRRLKALQAGLQTVLEATPQG
ncbi:hypothetical protein [Aliiroseovarius sp. YM-037]|uniref:hypothetical protein n=1 Tax=Aliiroseovarius sp. YM-037 TaxID=3341728 RepID=UPI003A7FF979